MTERPKHSTTATVVLLVTIFVLCLCIDSGLTSENNKEEPSWIMCYKCNSEYDPRCGDPIDPYSLGTVNCSLQEPLEHLPGVKPTICRKNVQKVQGKVRVVRGCGYIEDSYMNQKVCLYRSGTHDVNMHYCSCTGNLCNASPLTSAPQQPLVLVLLSPAAALLLKATPFL